MSEEKGKKECAAFGDEAQAFNSVMVKLSVFATGVQLEITE